MRTDAAAIRNAFVLLFAALKSPANASFLCVFAFFAAIYLLAGTTPPTDFDVLEYHLQIPKEWFQSGRIGFVPHNIYGNMPLGAEMHALAGMELWLGEDAWWYGAMVGKVVIALFAPLTALAFMAAGQRFYSNGAGMIGALIYLSFPWIAHVSFHGLNDAVLAHFVFLAIFAALLARNWQLQLIAGLLAGCAAACKYPGLLLVPLPVSLICLRTSGRARAAQTLACLVLGVALMAGPWYAKNFVATGNPFYPLASSVFGPGPRTIEQIAQWNQAHRVPVDELGRSYSLLQFASSAKQATLSSEWLGPIAWPLVVIGLIAMWRNRVTCKFLLAAVWILAIWFGATHRIDRFWLPAVPLLAAIAGGAWEWSQTRLYQRTFAALTMLGVLASTLMLIAPIYIDEQQIAISNPYWLTSLERLRKDGSSFAHQELRRLNVNGEAVLLEGDATPFDLEMPTYYHTCFDASLLEAWSKDRSTEQVRAALRDRQIGFVLVDWGEIARYRSPGNYGFSEYVTPELFQRLVADGILVPIASSDGNSIGPNWEIYRVLEPD